MIKPIIIDAQTLWMVAEDEPEAVRMAIGDLRKDWYKVIGAPPLIVNELPSGCDKLVLALGQNAYRLAGLKRPEYPGAESYRLEVHHDSVVLVSGADLRGCIYGIYGFSEHVLGVDPQYYWTDNEPEFCGQLSLPAYWRFESGSPRFFYRGWFVNDEAYLAGFAPDPLQENVFSLAMWDKVYESLLRLGGNMIVAGSFTFPDERARELATRRGLIQNDHHVCTAGLNTHYWPDSVPYSYHSHPEPLETAWRACIQAQADRPMVWTLGYRGKQDRPFWHDDPTLKTDSERGAMISRVIHRQLELVREVQPHADCIVNLWAEGEVLYRQGHLKLPSSVIKVWPDDGGTEPYPENLGSGIVSGGAVCDAGDGVYYHAAMCCGRANQLTEKNPPDLMAAQLRPFVERGATKYFLINVGDIRKVPLTTAADMKFAWNPEPFLTGSPAEVAKCFFQSWSTRQFGEKLADDVAEIYQGYFDIPYIKDRRIGDQFASGRLRHVMEWLAPGFDRVELLKTVEHVPGTLSHLAPLVELAQRLMIRVPESRRVFFHFHVLLPLVIHQRCASAVQHLVTGLLHDRFGERELVVAGLRATVEDLEEIFAEERASEGLRWRGWFLHDTLNDLFRIRELVLRLEAEIQGKPLPPVRQPGYYRWYDYHKKVRENYPFFYPHNFRLLAYEGTIHRQAG